MKTQTIKQRLLHSTMIGGTALMALVAAPALTLMTPSVAVAQNLTQGAVSGTVANQAGTPVAGANVTLTSVSQGFSRTFTTDASGGFRAVALPQGTYEVVVNAGGYNSLTDTVAVGSGGTAQLTLTLGASDDNSTQIDEVVVVGVRRAVSEFDATTTGLTVNVEELSRNIPIARDASAVALLAPGVTASDGAFGSIPTIGGSSAGENTYFINGLNITKFRDFTGSSTVPFEFYQTLETKTGGYSSEFGRGTGGVLNGTTKSGGNEWEFGITAYWSPDSLREDSPNTYLAQNNFDENETSDVIIDFGGPIIQDRLFLFGLYNFRDREATNIGVTTVDPAFGPGSNGTRVTSDDPFYGAKVDFLITDDHRLEFTYFSDEQEQQTENIFVNANGEQIGDFTPSTFKFGGSNWIARYTGVWTDWLTTSLAYGVNEYNEYNTSPGDAGALITDELPGFPRRGIWGVGQPSTNEDERTVLRADVDVYADFFGSHHFRFGLDQEKLESVQTLDYSGAGYSYCRPGGFANGIACTGEVTGGLWYRYQTLFTAATAGAVGRPDLIGAPRRVRIRAYDNDGGWSSTQNAYYLQDSWEVTDRLTLNLGIRNEGFENENIVGEAFVDLQNQWAPRLGATYDVFGDGEAKLFGFWGRYFLPVATNTNTRLAGAEFFISDTWNLNVNNGNLAIDADQNGIIDATDEPILGTLAGTSTLADGGVKPISTQVDAELDPMFVDEFILGYEQRVFGDWTLGVKGTYREIGTAIDDVAIDAAVLDYCDNSADLSAAICYNVWYGFHQYVLTNPGEDMVITLSGADLTNADAGPGGLGRTFTDREVTLSAADLGYPTPDRTYKAVEFSLDKPFDGVWGARFSYVWSENKGNYEGALKSDNGQTDPGLSQDFDQPGLLDNAYGFLPNHRAHTFKVFGNWQATPALNIGANLIIQSPRKFGCQGIHPTDVFASLYGPASWFCQGVATPRGSVFESDWLKNLDLTFAYDLGEVFEIPGDSLVLRADIFNVFDMKSQQDFNEFGDLANGSPDPNFAAVTAYQAPRQVRFSVAYRF
ncbi:outer membrane receptor for ferrienterochelin and colicin [Brevundimonas alba]|uniref:Outer membrane receptor for ferrienterochelin and colicin n=1 Tax=Brevundimonas alba TaxID=74314 RepID=A0A7X6BQ78_9CAUL|nr:TonB-dependent receptor [Brevundimonas alba]NJC42575.1 outer membrane receptor for ferrienterochelin and colicin [Brevundimonas alba]